MPRSQPPARSLTARPEAAWFDDAKFGVIIHWGPYSVPGWAERAGTIQDLWRQRGPNYYFKHNPYAEWYANTIKISGSGAQRHHAATYGGNAPYDAFAGQFDAAAATADFSRWTDLFCDAGARYVVLTTKHMDGYCLWPTRVQNPHKQGYHATRDLVAGVTDAVRARGLKMGLYYCAGYDMTFNSTVIRDAASAIRAIPQDTEYAKYVDRQLVELIQCYRPDVLWNDVAYPSGADLEELLAFYYRTVPDGVVNDRWARIGPVTGMLARGLLGAVSAALPLVWRGLPKSMRSFRMPQASRYDFATPEYVTEDAITDHKWEAVRGIGPSFGNNRNESDSDLTPSDQLIQSLVDVVSKNGNLLLGVGPEPSGDIPDLQQERLLGMGKWLAINGEAIFQTRPWLRAEGVTEEGLPVRFTCRDETVYAIVLGQVPSGPLVIKDVTLRPEVQAFCFGLDAAVNWERRGPDLSISVPPHLPNSPATAFRFS